jgi:hypothetical protein
MLRVILGRARPETEWSGKVSGLEFSSNPGDGSRSRGWIGRSRSDDPGVEFGANTILIVPTSRSEHEMEAMDGAIGKHLMDTASLSKEDMMSA